MAEKKVQVSPPANGYTRSDDEESTNSAADKELKRKKRIKFIVFCVVFQVIVPTVFFAIVMRAKTPKLRLSDDFEFQKLETNVTDSPSFDMSFTTQVSIKNNNWGPYKFDNTMTNFTYNGEIVGQVLIPEGKARFQSTKKVYVGVSLSSSQLRNTANLGSELNEGVLTLSSTAKMKGKVTTMLVMKSKKTAYMNCTINVFVKEMTVNLTC